jgi:UDP-N-acetyl-D-mannosaminuronic acid dehydrogenase
MLLLPKLQNADVAQVIKLANTHPRVFIHSPGPGVGGPCLTKDPYLLSFGVSGKRKRLITAARQLNDYMPKHIVDVILSELKKTGASIDSCKIAILGTAYKANVSDSRFSPSKPIIVELLRLGAKVLTYDPFCEDSFGAEKVDTLASSILGVDCVVILTDHAEFKAIDALIIAKSAKKNALIVDAKRLINEQAARQAGLRYYAIGYQTTGD